MQTNIRIRIHTKKHRHRRNVTDTNIFLLYTTMIFLLTHTSSSQTVAYTSATQCSKGRKRGVAKQTSEIFMQLGSRSAKHIFCMGMVRRASALATKVSFHLLTLEPRFCLPFTCTLFSGFSH